MTRIVELKKFTPFARFKNSGELKFRTETYLSLTKNNKIFNYNECIGVVVMLNPGSSCPKEEEYDQIVEAEPDITMQQIEDCVLSWHKNNLPSEGYIQIFNLFNLRCKKSKEAIKMYKKHKNNPFMKSKIVEIYPNTPWIWLAWGCNDDKTLQERKKEVFDYVTEKFSEKIIKKECESKNNKLGFWHPYQHGKTKQSKLLDYISKEIYKKIMQQN